MELSREKREQANYVVGMVTTLRGVGTHSEEEIAEKLEFKPKIGRTSAEVMYTQLQHWGLPDWLVCPDVPNKQLDLTKTKK